MAKTTVIADDKDKQQTPGTPGETAMADSQRAAAPKMQGFFNRHTSGYWAVMLPALSARYLPETIMKMVVANKEDALDKIDGKIIDGVKKKTLKRAFSDKWDTYYGLATGAMMMAVTTFYMRQTYKDLKSVFAEPVAAEMGKKPEDVNMIDLFKSDNTLVESARRNFLKYNARRYAVNVPFFGKHLIKGLSGDASVGFGVATNSIYLMNDVFRRKETFFESVQGFVESKIRHSEQLGDKITAIDLVNMYELHLRDKDKKHKFSGRMDTQEWNDRMKIFGRMADLMNKTYGNEPNKEHADFTVAKMIYLMGHGMIDSNNCERSCTYIEAANSKGLDAVKDIAKHPMQNGEDIAYARQKYLGGLAHNIPENTAAQPSFVAKYASEPSQSKTDKILTQRAAASETAFGQTV